MDLFTTILQILGIFGFLVATLLAFGPIPFLFACSIAAFALGTLLSALNER